MTGSGSFVGEALLRACDARGITVTGIDARAGARADCTAADIRSPTLAAHIPENVDAVIHLAALSRDSDCRDRPVECFDVNVMGTLNVVRAARQKRARQFIFASSEWVYGDFDGDAPRVETDPTDITAMRSEYALSKLVGEANLRQEYEREPWPVTILRFGIIYGPRHENWSAVESIVNSVATEDEVAVGALASGRHFIHVSDIADAILAAVGQTGFQILNIQGSRLVTLGEVIETAKALLGRAPRVVERTPDQVSRRPVSGALAKTVLGWQPQVEIETGIASVIEFLGLDAR